MCSRSDDLYEYLHDMGLKWTFSRRRKTPTDLTDDEVAILAEQASREKNKYAAFHTRLNDPRKFLGGHSISPLKLHHALEERCASVPEDLALVRSAVEPIVAEHAWNLAVNAMLPKLYQKGSMPNVDRLNDDDHGFLPVGIYDEDCLLLVVAPRQTPDGELTLAPGDDHEDVAAATLGRLRGKLKVALREIGVRTYRLVVANARPGERLTTWLKKVLAAA